MSKLEIVKRLLEGLSEREDLVVFAANRGREVLCMQPDLASAEEIWNHGRRLFPETGFWPVGTWSFNFQHLEMYGLTPEEKLQEIFRLGDLFNLAQFVSEQESIWRQSLGDEGYREERDYFHGEWPAENWSWYKFTDEFANAPPHEFRLLLVESS